MAKRRAGKKKSAKGQAKKTAKKTPVSPRVSKPTEKKKKRTPAKKAAPEPAYISKGQVKRRINVALSYKIVRLFSEGLYQSANKAFEELVTNSFDAGARNVNVLLPADPTADDATLVVADDGEGMDINGLEELWQVGVSKKRERADLPLQRRQIGQFGIGKLSTYVLAKQLTYVCKREGKFYAVSMDYDRLDDAANRGVATDDPVGLDVRELSRTDAQSAVSDWTSNRTFAKWSVRLFGKTAKRSWTFAILSNLRDKANEIEPGRLTWILRTALPLRDDFAIWMNGKQLSPSKLTKGRIGRWILGKDICKLSRPVPESVSVRHDEEQDKDSDTYHGLYQPLLGRVTGYAEAFKDVITTGKSATTGRSHGFFVYVLGRLINIEDAYFGIPSNRLAHGTFDRFRVVIHIDKLDDELQSDREGVRDGPSRTTVQNLLQALFYFVRHKIKVFDDAQTPARRMAGRIGGTPASLTRRPIVELAAAALSGEATPRYTKVPKNIPEDEHDEFIESLAERSERPSEFISGVQLSSSLSPEDGMAVYDTENSALLINCLHPFVGAFSSDFHSAKQSLPLELLAMAEVLLEAQLYHFGFENADIDEVLTERDELLRNLARSSGRRTALLISRALQDARNSQDQLEEELVASFESLGFNASHIGGSGHADGVAHAHLSAGELGRRRYSVSLEAKSKQKDGTKVSAKTVGVSTLVRHRELLKCDHAVVVGPDFPTTKGEQSALAREIHQDRENTGKTITLVTVDDMARLVQLAPLKQLVPSELRELFENCSIPEESREWINKIAKRTVKKQPYRAILQTIWEEQMDDEFAIIKYPALRAFLKKRKKPVIRTEAELQQLCRTMAVMAPGFITARDQSVEMEFPPAKVLEAVEAATQESEDEIDLD